MKVSGYAGSTGPRGATGTTGLAGIAGNIGPSTGYGYTIIKNCTSEEDVRAWKKFEEKVQYDKRVAEQMANPEYKWLLIEELSALLKQLGNTKNMIYKYADMYTKLENMEEEVKSEIRCILNDEK